MRQWDVCILNGESRLANHASCASRRQNADILLGQTLSQIQQSGLVVDGDDGDLLVRHCEAGQFFLLDNWKKKCEGMNQRQRGEKRGSSPFFLVPFI